MSEIPPPMPTGDPALQLSLERGIRATRRGKYEAAQQHLSHVLKAQPQNELALLWMVQACVDPQQKWEYLSLAQAVNPGNMWVQQQIQALQAGGGAAAAGSADEAAPASEPAPLFGKLKVRELKCPSCAGACKIHGTEVKTVVCQYCSTTLELSGEEMQAITAPKPQDTPSEPIKPGMECTFGSTRYMVIGWIRFKGWDDEDTWYWEEWLLAGEDASYAWLQKDEAGWQFYHRLPIKNKMDPRADRIPVPGGHARVKERAPALISSIQGELTWRAQIGDTLTYVDAQKGGKTYSLEYNDHEIELLVGTKMEESEIWEAMDLKALQQAAAHVKTRSRTAMFGCLGSFAVAMLAIFLMFATMTTRSKILDETATLAAGVTGEFGPVTFEDRDVHELDIEITGIKEGDTATVALQLVDEQGESYNMRYRQSKSGSRFDLKADFRPIPGTYTVKVAVQSSPAPCTVKVAAYSGVIAGWWLLAVIPLAGLIGVINLIRLASSKRT